MLENEPKLKLSDLIDINFLQELQDVFAATANVASLTYDDDIPITKPSNFTDFCMKYTRGSSLGFDRCKNCDLKWGNLAALRGEPVIYKCHTGLMDFAVPIMVEGRHLATIFGGQVLTEPPNEEHFRAVARQLSINEDEYIDAVRKIKIVPEETVKAAAHMLSLVANSLSEIGLKNLKLIQKNKKEEFFRLIMETVTGTLDIGETKKRVVDIIGKTLNADRCFIVEFDKDADKFLIVKDEYLSSDIISSYLGADVESEVPHFVEEIKKGKLLVINNKEITLDTKNEDFDLEKDAIERHGVNSAYGVPLFYLNEFVGVLSVHYVNKAHVANEEEASLLTMISSQVAILIHQANLYKTVQLRGERDTLYRIIMEAVRGSLDIKKTKNKIVEVVCKSLKADRCFIVDYDQESDKFLEINDEYLSSDDILGHKGIDINVDIPNIALAVKSGKNLIINDKKIYLDSDNPDLDAEKIAIEKFGVNSAYAFPLYYADELLGALAIQYVKTKHIISEEDIKLLNGIANQISLAIHQANLYDLLIQKSKDQDAILNNMPFMAWLKDAKGAILAANKAYARTCNLEPAEIIGKTDFDFFPKEYAESYTLEDKLVMETLETLQSEDIIAGPEGEKWHETFKSPVFDNEGRAIGTVGISQDITDRKNLEMSIIENKNQLNAILDNIPHWAWLKDKENKFILVNKRLAEDKKLSPDFFVGKTDFDLFPKELAEKYANDDKMVIDAGETIMVEEESIINGEPRVLETYKQPFFNAHGEIVGTVGIAKDITERKASESELLQKQAQIVRAADREKLSRKIIEKIRSTLDINELFELICQELLSLYNVQRSFIVEFKAFDEEHSEFNIRKELKSGPEIHGLYDKKFDYRTVEYWGELLCKEGKKIVLDNIEESDTPDYFKETYRNMGLKSIMGVAVKKDNDFWGWIGVSEYNYCRHWSEDEISLLESISSQIYIAIKQAELYKITQIDAQREALLRSIIEKTRISFDVDDVLSFICEETAKLFNVQRVVIADYPSIKNLKSSKIRNEYKSSTEIAGLDYIGDFSELAVFWGEHLISKSEVLAFDNIAESKVPDKIKSIYAQLGVKSVVGIPIRKGEKIWGNLVLSEYNDYRHWSEAEISLLETISGQIFIAINQAELFAKEKKTAEREKLIGTVISKAISTFDINQMKQIVNDIGKVTKADRCYFVEVDLDEMCGKQIDSSSEYLSSEDIKSVVGYDFKPEDVQKFVEIYLEARDLVVFDYEKILLEQEDKYSGIKKYINRFDLKSGIGIPFIHKDKLTAVIAIEYVKEAVFPSEDELDFLRILANQTGMAFNQIKLYQDAKQTAEREIFLREIIQTLRSSMDINEVKKNITEKLCNAFNADRCYFRSYDTKEEKILIPDVEYLSSDDVESLLNLEPEQEGLNYFVREARKHKRGFYPIVVDEDFAKNTPMEHYMSSLGIKADYAVPIIDREDELTWLVLHYTKKNPKLSEEDKKLLETIAYQIDIVFGQLKAHIAIKEKAEREALLRDITEKIRSSLDIEETLSFICEETAKLFNVQRSAITSFPSANTYVDYTLRKEYKSSPEIIGYGKDENFAQVAGYWGQNLLKLGNVMAFDDIIKADVPDYFKNTYAEMGIKSIIGTSIKKGKDVLGTIVLSEYNRSRRWTEEEKNLLNIIADQVYIAINQAELYNSANKAAEKEKALREIMLSSVSTTEMKEALTAIVTRAGKLLKADRCFFVEIDTVKSSVVPIKDYAQYRSSDDIRSLLEKQPTTPETEGFIGSVKEKKVSVVENIEKIDLPEITRNMLVNEFSVKSYLILPVFYEQILYGSLVFHYVNDYKRFSQDEVDVAQAIANQSAIVIHKAKLYEMTQTQAERETLLRKTFEAMRSSLDINNIKTSIVTEVCKALGADRCFIIEYNKEIDEFMVISDEYLASEEIQSYRGANINIDVPNFAAILKRGENIIVNNREVYMDADPQKIEAERETIEKYNVNSAFAFPLYYSNELLGAMAIHYVDREHTIVNDEINLLNIIANQISIAIHQAKLYKITQVQAEREKISRNIVEILRSSLDRKTIKRLFVKNIGKYFNADRVLFSDYDEKIKMYLPVDEYSEYLSAPELKSFIGYDWSCEESREYIQPLLEKREFKISEWNEYIRENPKGSGFISLFEDADVKSSYNFPVLYQDKIMGFFCIEFTRAVSRFSEEDINRIRSMCTQSGIALYQAELYQKVQESDRIKGEFITNISNKFREPLNNIIEFSEIIPKGQVNCEKQTEYLNNINETGKKLLNFTNYIAKVSAEDAAKGENLN